MSEVEHVETTDAEAKAIKKMVEAASKSAQGEARRAHKDKVEKLLKGAPDAVKAKLRGVQFLGAASAKVLHSSQTMKWWNSVQYLAPADRAAMSFMHEFPDFAKSVAGGHGLPKMVEAIRAGGPAWGRFAATKGVRAIAETKRLLEGQEGPLLEDYVLPDYNGQFLSLCPFASPDCRKVCLNTSGQGGMARTGLLEKYRLAARHGGYTGSDDVRHVYLKGYPMIYGGENNQVTAARIRRTHVMFLAWMRDGVIDNLYNEMLYDESLIFLDRAEKIRKQTGMPNDWNMALRLNGTSDFPAHTLRAYGSNLMASLHGKGIVCYDYTKDHGKMMSWMSARNWNPALKKATIKNTFPNNYHLVFSWSEINGKEVLQVLMRGGNVVMVFRRSPDKGQAQMYPVGTKAGSKGIIPNRINLTQLGGGDIEAQVLNGDAHDLRFLDPYNVGKENKGSIVGVIAKGSARKWDAGDRDKLKRFVLNTRVEQKGKKVYAVLTNPAPAVVEGGAGQEVEGGAVQEVDGNLLNQATINIGGFLIAPTGMGT
jgi:hypothetical protein